jgi:hypothetical protein
LWEDVGLDLVGPCQVHQNRGVDERTGDAAFEHSLVTEPRSAFLLAVADPHDVDERQVAGRAFAQETGFHSLQDRLRDAMSAPGSAHQHIRTGGDEPSGLGRTGEVH